MTLRERMARAMRDKLENMWESREEPIPAISDSQYELMADACLRAMREPGAAIVRAGNEEASRHCLTEGYYDDDSYAQWDDGALETWQAMIDAALSEGQQNDKA